METAETGLLRAVRAVPVIDTHEHLAREEQLLAGRHDFFSLLVPYVSDELVNAGMPTAAVLDLLDGEKTLEERWMKIEKFMPLIRFTGFYRALAASVAQLTGSTEISLSVVEEVSRRIGDDWSPGLYRRCFATCGIVHALTFVPPSESGDFGEQLTAVPTLNDLFPRASIDLQRLGAELGAAITSFDGYLAGLDSYCERMSEEGIRTVKFSDAYQRELRFDPVTRHEAEAAFNTLLQAGRDGEERITGAPGFRPHPESLASLHSYAAARLLDYCSARGMTAVFHTGMHAFGFNLRSRAGVGGLEELVRRYPRIRFVLLHAAVPFIDDALHLARGYPNCSLDLTWTQIIEPGLARRLLSRTLDALPLNKVSAFGGDYSSPFLIGGHLEICRSNIAVVLGKRMREGMIDARDADEIVRAWLYRTPLEIHQLSIDQR